MTTPILTPADHLRILEVEFRREAHQAGENAKHARGRYPATAGRLDGAADTWDAAADRVHALIVDLDGAEPDPNQGRLIG